MFERILVPVDLSSKGRSALATARELSAPGAVVTLVHVIETLEDVPFEEMEDFYRRLEARAIEMLDEWVAAFERKGGRAERRVLFGRRLEEILRFASEQESDLILLRSHTVDPDDPTARGRGWATLSYRIAVLAECPVLLLK
ncbi:MAG: universal stress protein [Acidobacteriota bacterium]|jgi:universal stress protein A